MDLNEYQKLARKTAVYPRWMKPLNVMYPLLGLAGEVGELLNKYKKIIRGDEGAAVNFRQHAEDELGDILWYLSAVATDLEISLNDVARFNLKKLALRAKTGRIKGSGDSR